MRLFQTTVRHAVPDRQKNARRHFFSSKDVSSVARAATPDVVGCWPVELLGSPDFHSLTNSVVYHGLTFAPDP